MDVLREREDMLYEKLAHFAGTLFGGMVKEPKSPDIKEGIDFTGLRVTTKEVESFAVLAAVTTAFVFIILTFLSLSGMLDLPWYIMALLIIGAPMGAYAFYSEYPKSYANIYRIKAVGSMPELISNLAISLKLVPNLENAAAFASRTTRGHMGDLLKRTLWKTYSRSYVSAEHAVVSLADRWKRWNDDFARSLYLLRTSLEERSEARRLAVLDKAVDTILKGTSEKIDDFASSLYMPTMTFYFMGVIIPLVLIAVLPVIAFTGSGGLGAKQLALIYDILLPVMMFYATSWILNRRPVTIPPPDIKDHPDVPPAGQIMFSLNNKSYSVNGIILAFIAALPFIALGLFRLVEVLNTPLAPPKTESAVPGMEVQAQAASPLPGLDLTLLILFGTALGLFIYFVGTNWQRKKVRDDVLQAEREFIDGLTQLGNRLSDGKPMEDAIVHVAKVMGDTKISKVFNDAARAVMIGRASLRSAFFDQKEGALRYVYSDTIKNVLHKVIEGNEKGAQTASITIFKTVEQLQKVQAIERSMKKKLDEVVTPMRLIIVGVGPAVAGVVVVLQKLINSYLIKSSGFTAPGSVSGVGGTGLPGSVSVPIDTSKLDFASKSIPSELLLIIVGIYLVLMVLILSRYMSGINHGEDKVAQQLEMGTNVIISVVIYAVTIAFTGLFLGSANIQI